MNVYWGKHSLSDYRLFPALKKNFEAKNLKMIPGVVDTMADTIIHANNVKGVYKSWSRNKTNASAWEEECGSVVV
jgi:hypothetical protein